MHYLLICPLSPGLGLGGLPLVGFSGKGIDQITAFPACQWPAPGPSDAPTILESGSGNGNCPAGESFELWATATPWSKGQQGPQNNSRVQCLVTAADVSGQRRATWGSVTGQCVSSEASSDV